MKKTTLLKALEYAPHPRNAPPAGLTGFLVRTDGDPEIFVCIGCARRLSARGFLLSGRDTTPIWNFDGYTCETKETHTQPEGNKER